MNRAPFLWKHLRRSAEPKDSTGGSERPLTGSANEENRKDLVFLE
ncbi:MAG TPA: hypothetical protein VF172_13740 [Nitrososphaera sp.]